MTARDVVQVIESLPKEEFTKVQAWLRSQDAAREETLDLVVLKERADKPGRDFRAVLSDLGIQPE